MVSSDKEKRKKKIAEIQIFPVPFPLEKIKGNITITTNTFSNSSIEQIQINVPLTKSWDHFWNIVYSLISKDEPLILEIGAHYGKWSKKFIKLFKNPTIYMFECDPRCLKRIKEEFSELPKINIVNKAISNKNSAITFFQSSSKEEVWDCSGSINPYEGHRISFPSCEFIPLTVEGITLDNWAKDNNIKNVDLITIDVIGAELEVLRGGVNTFKEAKYILIRNYIDKTAPQLHSFLNELKTYSVCLFAFKQKFYLLKNNFN